MTFHPYFMQDYYMRVEFQARGAPHVHCLLWLTEQVFDENLKSFKYKPLQTMYTEGDNGESQAEKKKEIEKYADQLISASTSSAICHKCKENKRENSPEELCEECELIKSRVLTYNNHICGFSCHKRKKTLYIKPDEGHGKFIGKENLKRLFMRYAGLTIHNTLWIKILLFLE